MRTILLSSLSVALSAAFLDAQTATPTTYTLTQTESWYTLVLKTKTYRNGSKRVMDEYRDGVDRPPRRRQYWDLQTHDWILWDLSEPNPPCTMQKGTGKEPKESLDLADPFWLSAGRADDLLADHPTRVGTETLNGFTVDLYVFRGPEGEHKLWLEPKMKLIVKLERTAPEAPPHTILETLELSLDPPPAAVFQLPASCAADDGSPK
jgi:hypothetical protein